VDRYRASVPDASPGTVLTEMMTDWFYRIPAIRLAEAHPACHVYEFGSSPIGGLGACHMLESTRVDSSSTHRLTGPCRNPRSAPPVISPLML
jgi:para-nitrobenzyl esterase